MEDTQSKMAHLGMDLLYFLIIVAASLAVFAGANAIQDAKEKNDLKRHSMIVTLDAPYGVLPEDAGDDVYVGENGSPTFKTITGDGDVVTKAAVYTDLLNLPNDISKVVIDGTVYSNGSANNPTIDGNTNIAYMIKNGQEREIYRATLQTKGETFIRTYTSDNDGNIIAVKYTSRSM